LKITDAHKFTLQSGEFVTFIFSSFVLNVGPKINVFYYSFALLERVRSGSIKVEEFLNQLNGCQIIEDYGGFEVLSGGYKEFCLLGYNAVYSAEY
jgi:hypothetical protein